jgi:hypothetical protein
MTAASREDWERIVSELAGRIAREGGSPELAQELTEYSFVARRSGHTDLADALGSAAHNCVLNPALAYADLLKALTPNNYGPKH